MNAKKKTLIETRAKSITVCLCFYYFLQALNKLLLNSFVSEKLISVWLLDIYIHYIIFANYDKNTSGLVTPTCTGVDPYNLVSF